MDVAEIRFDRMLRRDRLLGTAMDGFVQKEWLTKRTTAAAATKRYPALASQLWRVFWAEARDGDELWYFKTPPVTWQKRMGRMGVAVARGGVIVAHASVGVMN